MMNRFEPHERITSALLSEIESSLFEFFYFDAGGAISISKSDYSLSLKSSLFRFCITSNIGGAILLNGKQVSTSDSCFDTCHNTAATDSVFGNAIYSMKLAQETGVSSVNRTSFLACGPAGELAGDSTIYFNGQQLESENINFTHCSGSGGSTSMILDQNPGRSKYLSTYCGFASHLTCTINQANLKLQSANF